MLVAQDLKKVYKDRTVVKSVSLTVNRGESVGILGANGAGKTTTFYMIMGLVKPNAGKISYNNQGITRWPLYKRARLGIGYLPQETALFHALSVADNIRMVWELTSRLSSAAQHQKLMNLLAMMTVTHLKDTRCGALSGGEKRRVELARLLATDPEIVLLDEPFAGVDPIAVADIKRSIGALKALGLGVLITDHNVRETLAITDRAYILHDGQVLTAGTPDEIIANPEAQAVYLGDTFL